jgi:hypothetical protein
MPKVSIMTDDKYPISESNDIGGIGDGLGGIGDGLICAILLVPSSRPPLFPSSRPVLQSAAISVGCGAGIGLPHHHRESR